MPGGAKVTHGCACYAHQMAVDVVTQIVINRHLARPFPMEMTYTGASLGAEQTRKTLRNHGEP